MNVRRWLLGGALAFGLSGVALSRAGVTATGPGLVLAGILLLTLASVAGFGRVLADFDRPSLGTPELIRLAPVPGAELDDRFRNIRNTRVGGFRRDQLRKRLASLARDLFVGRVGLDPDTADERICSGNWTDDKAAARFLRDGSLPRQSLWTRLRHPVRSDDGYVAALDRTVEELFAVAAVNSELSAPSSGDEYADSETPIAEGVRETHHWRGISAFAVATLAIGLLSETPALVLGTAVGIGYAAYANVRPSIDMSLSVERALRPREPDPGDEVTVWVTVRNEGNRALSDLRMVDGVPPDLRVSSGTPRHGTVLPPGETATIEYRVRARRGVHEFGPLTVCLRPISETTERVRHVEASTDLVCRPQLAPPAVVPTRELTTALVGQVPTASGGAGIAFHGTREYRRGDPTNRIDWKRFAKTGELATITYTEERAGHIVIAVDTREEAHVSPAHGESTAHDRSVSAAGDLFATFQAESDQVGLVAVGPDKCWLPPQKASIPHVREQLTHHPAFGHDPPTDPCYLVDWLKEFRVRFTRPAHVVVLSPLCDEGAATFIRRLELYGYPVTVVSPDPTSGATLGGRVARLERAARVSRLRDANVRVIDWGRDESVATAVARGEYQ